MIFIYILFIEAVIVLTIMVIKYFRTKDKEPLISTLVEKPLESMHDLRKEFLSRYIYLSSLEKISNITSVISEYSNNLEKIDYYLLRYIHKYPSIYSNSLIKSLNLVIPIENSSDSDVINARECYEEFLSKTTVVLTEEEADLLVKYSGTTKKRLYEYFLYEEYLQ